MLTRPGVTTARARSTTVSAAGGAPPPTASTSPSRTSTQPSGYSVAGIVHRARSSRFAGATSSPAPTIPRSVLHGAVATSYSRASGVPRHRREELHEEAEVHARRADRVRGRSTAALAATWRRRGRARRRRAFKVAWIYPGPYNDGGWSTAHDPGRQYAEKVLGAQDPDHLQGQGRSRTRRSRRSSRASCVTATR